MTCVVEELQSTSSEDLTFNFFTRAAELSPGALLPHEPGWRQAVPAVLSLVEHPAGPP